MSELRQEIARIIDPSAWEAHDNANLTGVKMFTDFGADVVRDSLSKADQILPLISKAEQRGAWQSIETAPKATPVLVYDAGDVSVAVLQPSSGQWHGVVDGGLVGIPRKGQDPRWFLVGKPTHWQPLPAPPLPTEEE